LPMQAESRLSRAMTLVTKTPVTETLANEVLATEQEPSIAEALLCWWDSHGRKDLPWQINPTPYRVWVSEIMLQQTQVTTVVGYYERFLRSFPDADTLASASQDTVLNHWSGLGYYSRARNLHKAAQTVATEYGGELPVSLDELMDLPGIGRSTAGAILALSSGQRHPILDGNARRVLARYFAVEGWSGATPNQKKLWQLADQCTPYIRVANYTQAIMDLGATLCKRGIPDCENCPLSEGCQAFYLDKTGEIPAPKPKKVRPLRSAILLMARDGDSVLLEKRPPNGIWGGLWSFPEFETHEKVEAWCASNLGQEIHDLSSLPEVVHKFSHFDFCMQPLQLRVEQPFSQVMEADRWLWYNTRSPADIGLASPIARLIQELK